MVDTDWLLVLRFLLGNSVLTVAAYGGSWADEEIDMASISVPIEKNRGYNYGSDNRYGGGFGGSRGGFGKPVDNGPPYIVKLSNIPLTSDDGFIEDLFQSRFTQLVKFKIIFDPTTRPLELGIVKKIAFVELRSFADQTRVSKWQDVVFKGTRRINIEVADFQDFQYCMGFNQENQGRLSQVEQEFLTARPRQGNIDDRPLGGNRFHPNGRAPGGMPLDEILPASNRRIDHRVSNGFPNRLSEPTGVSSQAFSNPPLKPRPKHNPFGNAKPVDVIAKEHEMESTYAQEHHSLPPQLRRKSSVSNAQRPNFQDKYEHDRKPVGQISGNTSGTKLGDGSVAKKQTFADVLSSQKEREPVKQISKSSGANATVVRKPVILKKKPLSSTEAEKKKLEANSVPSEKVTREQSGAADEGRKIHNEPMPLDASKGNQGDQSPNYNMVKKDKAFDSSKKAAPKCQVNDTTSQLGETAQGKGSRSNKQRLRYESASEKFIDSTNVEGEIQGLKNDKKVIRDPKGNSVCDASDISEARAETRDGVTKEATPKRSAARRRSHRKRDETPQAQASSQMGQNENGVSKPIANVIAENKNADAANAKLTQDQTNATRRNTEKRRGRHGLRGVSRRGRAGSKEDNSSVQANTTASAP